MKGPSSKNDSYTISLRDVTKSFTRQGKKNGYSTIKSALLSIFKKASGESASSSTVALKSLTMRVPTGSSVGVIGRNGSGKSTLLKLITGIYKPDGGEVWVSGRVSALIELGAGFHPDFTGRENIFLGGMIQGLTRQQIKERFNEIVAFAELEDFIDEPVRTYSSGMFMRLGFSLAIHADPEVLLIDEVLAVGDEGFVSKCKGKIAELRKQGVTLMLVTHDLAAVERWSDEVIWLDKGKVMERGEPRRVIDAYRQFIEDNEERGLEELHGKDEKGNVKADKRDDFEDVTFSADDEQSERWGSREVEIVEASLLNDRGEEHFVFHPNDTVTVRMSFRVRESVQEKLVFGVGIHHADGTNIFGTNTDIERVNLFPEIEAADGYSFSEGYSGVVECTISQLALLSGEYWLDVAVHREDGYPYDYLKHSVKFSVRSGEQQVGKVYLETGWTKSDGTPIDHLSRSRSVA